jgi:hypothetical protein
MFAIAGIIAGVVLFFVGMQLTTKGATERKYLHNTGIYLGGQQIQEERSVATEPNGCLGMAVAGLGVLVMLGGVLFQLYSWITG